VPPSACDLVGAYEKLRRAVLEDAGSGNHFGLAVLLQEGVAAWLARTSPRSATDTPPTPKQRRPPGATAPLVCNHIHAAMVAVLANMVMAIPQEECA